MAKLWILQFYYDSLDKFLDRCDYELIQMDTDSLLFRAVVWFGGRGGASGATGRVQSMQKKGFRGTNGASTSLGCSRAHCSVQQMEDENRKVKVS